MNTPASSLQRATFQTNRLLEFFTEKELSMQIGHGKELWPTAILKELIDNALDACEAAGIAPEIAITGGPDSVSVHDNGPGLPVSTLERSLDYLVRVSDKAYYVSPTHGQLGNALKTVWAAPFVADGEQGTVEVVTGGHLHTIDVTLDRIAQEPKLVHTTSPDGFVKIGTLIKVHWPEIASYPDDAERGDFYNAHNLAREYAAFNPHATFTSTTEATQETFPRAAPDWQKWRPSDPTSPHWYTPERLRMLVAAYIKEEQEGGRVRTVREFVAEFAGLSGSAKQKAVTEAAGLSGAYLHDLVEGGDVAVLPIRELLHAMWLESREIKPDVLGVLGEAHCKHTLMDAYGVEEWGISYKKKVGMADGVPFVFEVACGLSKAPNQKRYQVVGINWSPTLKAPFLDLPSLLAGNWVDDHDPIVILVHLVSPVLNFTDRGKSTVVLPFPMRSALAEALASVTKWWKSLKRQVHRDAQVKQQDIDRARKQQQVKALSIKEAAYEVMEEAYNRASDNGRLPANARQVMYAARPLVLRLLNGRPCWKHSSYFTQTLLPDFVEEHPELTAGWDVVFDDRGHFTEPHTGHTIGLGTLKVRQYIESWEDILSDTLSPLAHTCPTFGPCNRYRFALFVEKEGFNSLLEAAQIAERFDLAIMSTKGMSVTASRNLVGHLTKEGVTILVLHDFDKSGFSILHTLRSNTRRFHYTHTPNVIDLGLRLADVEGLGLESEPVEYGRGVDPRVNLGQSGAAEEECAFLVRSKTGNEWSGERVELNAMTSPQFLAWLEAKLIAAGVEKVLPNQATLQRAFARATRIKAGLDAMAAASDKEPAPADLAHQISERIAEDLSLSWDEALWQIVQGS